VATKRTRGKQAAATKGKASKGWTSLTWDDLDAWAGTRSVARGRAYQRQRRVKDLAISGDGRLLATVLGGERYVTSVWRTDARNKADAIQSDCTCPVGCDCKHAVAVVAEYLEMVAKKQEVPAADPDDPRWEKLGETNDEDEFDDYDSDDEWYDDESDADDEEECDEEPRRKRRPARATTRRTGPSEDEKLRAHIGGKTHDELVEMVLSLSQRFPELRTEFREQIALREGNVGRLLADARRELQSVTEEMGWRNHWNDEGHTPDYSRLKHRLERLVEAGHCEAVVDLGRELFARAMQQVEQSHDEGETAMEVADCMSVVFDAVKKSKLSTPQKLLFAIDACLQDDYNVVDEATHKLLNAKWTKADWSAVADELRQRLAKTKTKAKGDDGEDDDAFHRNYRRDQLSSWLLEALANAGRDAELLPIYEAEARATGSYQRLVGYLIGRRKFDEAERWAREGIEKTVEKLPGIAAHLAESLCEVYRGRRCWGAVAAHAAWTFFDRPSRKTFDELLKTAAKAKCAEHVRQAALAFLETGVAPLRAEATKKGAKTLHVDPSWPLPVPDYLAAMFLKEKPAYWQSRPHFDVLLDMAIADKRPDDVLHWYEKMKRPQQSAAGGWGGYGDSWADRVADAVTKSHPERALEIYRAGLDAQLPHADARCYEAAGRYLKLMRPILTALGRADEWTARVAEIREKYRNRPNFMEVLDRLAGRTIVAAHKARRGRK
jgi:uncharacterized Zn finger protein